MYTALVDAVINMGIQIYHNPRCTKSRLTLAILEEKGLDVEVIEYLKQPPTATELDSILNKLGKEPLDFMRKGEDAFKTHIQGKELTRAALITLMVAHPTLIERPIVINGNKAAVGRPPELILPVIA